MMFSRPLSQRNKSKSRAKSQAKQLEKSPFSFKQKNKQIVDVPSLINLSPNVLLAGSQNQLTFQIVPLQELFEESGKRVVNCKIDVKDQNIAHSFWLGDPQSQNLYQTFDTCLISTPTKIKIVGQCPQVPVTTQVTGSLQITFQGLSRVINIPIQMVCEVPKIVCLTNLQNVQKGYSVIRVPVKNKTISNSIAFKNDSSLDLNMEVNLIGYQKQGAQKYQLITQKSIHIKGCQKFYLQFDLIENPHFGGENLQINTIRKLIQLKLPGCSQFFVFPFQVLVYELPEIL